MSTDNNLFLTAHFNVWHIYNNISVFYNVYIKAFLFLNFLYVNIINVYLAWSNLQGDDEVNTYTHIYYILYGIYAFSQKFNYNFITNNKYNIHSIIKTVNVY